MGDAEKSTDGAEEHGGGTGMASTNAAVVGGVDYAEQPPCVFDLTRSNHEQEQRDWTEVEVENNLLVRE